MSAKTITGAEADYAYFSDDAITVALSVAGNGITRAVSVLIKQLALSLTIAGQNISAGDFKINTLGKGKDLLEVAKNYELQADAEDARDALEMDGGFLIVNSQLREHPALSGEWI